ncbi:response regulator transcription factor [Anaeromicropila herbilytica]|uniref:Stage 0 sporulation protein A homolog n=1 Tax=Anaeromicropila herbilytica TaxID=2785025 RepID=A0A7R7EPJ0_9FIRM|nr:response regulator transcription factor [Anaeromicropila herbilytica]BCN32700.1 DNA-binding response regulator [Anaeromicropila herbilytica]
MRNGKNVILLVEDDVKLRTTINEYLKLSGYEVMTAINGREALEVYCEHNTTIELVILDVMMPELNGYEVLDELRRTSEVPVIMLTAKSKEEDQLYAFDKGADTYMTKPFKLSLLKAQIKAILKRVGKSSDAVKKAGELKIIADSQQALLENQIILTTPKEFELLSYFVDNINLVLTREQILNAVWGYDYEGENRTVDTIVKQLRSKLTDQYPYIKSIYGVGYRFEV